MSLCVAVHACCGSAGLVLLLHSLPFVSVSPQLAVFMMQNYRENEKYTSEKAVTESGKYCCLISIRVIGCQEITGD